MRQAILIATAISALSATATAHEGSHTDPATDMAAAAQIFLASLSDEQRAKATFGLESDHREQWYFVPKARKGLVIKDMSQQQRLLAHALLSTAMSSDGYRQAAMVMTLEAVLRELEGSPIRDPELYYVSIFGKPGAEGSWAWRFEGHHLSLNVAVAGGRMYSVTPSFFGTNPAIVKEGGPEGLEVLADEQNLARTLVNSLNDEQRALAVLPGDAPADIITKQKPRVAREDFLPVKGISYDKLNVAQQKLLMTLLWTYAVKYRHEIVDEINGRHPIDAEGKLHFAWAGSTEPGKGHYYRIQSEKFLFEYDNTQNGANHVHAVWRDFDGDFGRDLLKEHLEAAHR